MNASELPKAALIEIIERNCHPDDSMGVILPDEVRINGVPILMPDDPIVIHETVIGNDVVKVTMTMFARRVVIGREDRKEEGK